MCQIGAPAIFEIHDRERNLTHDVDPAHRLVELDAIEDGQFAVDARDIVEMQVAMALANEAVLAPAQERAPAGGVLAFGPGGKCIDLVVLLYGREQRPQLREVLPRHTQHLARCAERATRARRAGRTVKSGHLHGQRVDVRGLELAPRQDLARQRVLRKLAHHHCVLERRAVAADDRGVDAARDRHDVEVERGCESAI